MQNFRQTANFARRAGASVPQWLADRFDGLEDDPATRRLVAAAVCAEQVIDLIDHGVEELHFYTMNRADLVFAICHLIGLRAKPESLPSRRREVGEPARRACGSCSRARWARPDAVKTASTRRRGEATGEAGRNASRPIRCI